MRKSFFDCATLAEAKKLAPWAAKIVRVDGGFLAFESPDDYRVWKNQK
ncbi:MAG: hypothetical protein M0R06_02500 [Sphaerochaeta sp.]|jgi:hypothetical protein|nr:hypothetical protein [Sphaerochaeta sp.]